MQLSHDDEKIDENEKNFRILSNAIPSIIWITNPEGSCTYLNQQWYSYTGQTEEKAEGFGWLDATHPDDRKKAEDVF